MLVILCLPCTAAYSWRAQVDLGAATSGTLTNITLVTVTVADSHLKTVANGGTINDATCTHAIANVPCDFLITDSAICGASGTAYKWGFETYDGTAGTARVWILVPSLGASHAIPYICTGDASVHTYQGGSSGSEFDAATELDYHMSDSGGTLTDFSANADDAAKKSSTQPNPTTSGKIGGAQVFVSTLNSANNDYATFSSAMADSTVHTLEAWINSPLLAGGDNIGMIWESNPASPTVGFCQYWFPNGTIVFENSFNTDQTPTAPFLLTANTWHHLVYVRNGDSANIYIDSVAGTSKSGYGTFANPWIGLGWAGGANASLQSLRGTLDEVKFSTAARSAAWIATEYANQNNPPAITGWTALSGGASTLPLLGVGH